MKIKQTSNIKNKDCLHLSKCM